jgi:hypothetical protein
MNHKLLAATAIILTGITVTACSGQAGNGSLTCQTGTDPHGVPGWSASFTNTTSTDITVNSYTALFFDSAGNQTGSADAVNTGFTVSRGNTYTDAEYHSFLAPIPPDSVSCRITNVSQS